MRDLAFNLNNSAQVIPSRKLANGENISVVQTDIGVWFTRKGLGDLNVLWSDTTLSPFWTM